MRNLLDKLPAEVANTLLQRLPMGLALIGSDGSIAWVNETLCSWLDVAPEDLLGKPANEPLSGRLVVHSGIAQRFFISPGDGRGGQWMEYTRHPAPAGVEGIAEVSCLIDVFHDDTRRRSLTQVAAHVPEVTRIDNQTGLLNRKALLHELAAQVSRSRRYGNPLSVMLVSLDTDAMRASWEDGMPDPHRAIAQALKGSLRWVDLVGTWSDREFLVILPETRGEPAGKLVAKLERELAKLCPGAVAALAHLAVVEWRQGEDPGRLVQRLFDELATPTEPAAEAS